MLLRELYEAKARRVVAVMPGGFHPFHPGHKSLYDWAVKTFGQKNVYVAATNDTKARPFPFEVKKKLAAMAGVPESNFMQVKSPFNNREYAGLLDADTALVFVRSQKDKNEQPLPDQTKKNGEPGYLRTYTGKNLNTADEMGYMAYGPTINFDFSGMQIKSASELRATWPEMSDEDKLKAAKLMYGNGAPVAVKLLNQALGGSVEEGDVIPFKKSNPANPKLDKDALDTWNKERNQKRAQDMIRLAPEIVEYYKELKDQNTDTETAIDIIAYDFDIDQYDVKRILQANNIDEDATPDEEDEFHRKLDKLVHKTFGHSSDEKKKKKKKYDEADLNEIAPAVGVAAKWIIKWAIQKGAWSVLKWILKKYWKKIAVGTIAYKAIDEGWDWVKGQIGEEMAQMLIDNGFEIGMAVALIIGAVMLKRWVEKHGEKFAARYAEGDTAWMN